MLLMALPAALAPVAAILAALFALVGGLTFSRRTKLNTPEYDDVEARFSDLQLKVRHPLKYRARQAERWMNGR